MTGTTNRKAMMVGGDSHTSTLSPIPSRPVGGNQQKLHHHHHNHHHHHHHHHQASSLLTSPEYMEAINTLNEATMNQACELLLADDVNDDSSAKLLDMYKKCHAAHQIIQKHQQKHQQELLQKQKQQGPAVPGINNTPASTGSGIGRVGSSHNLSKKMTNKKQGVVPMRGRKGPLPLRRDRSDSNGDKYNHEPPTKKARQNNTTEISAPPSSALNFLAKLNKGGVDKKRRGSS